MSSASNAIKIHSLRAPIFSGFYERLNLFCPFPFVVMCLYEIAYSYQFTEKEKIFSTFLTSFIFLNNIHTYFTFSFLLSLPEFKGWFAHRRKAKLPFWRPTIFVFLLISGIYLSFFLGILPKSLWLPGLLITILIPIHHGVRQIQGLSLIYNRNLEQNSLSALQTEQLKRTEKRERISFDLFLLFYCLYIVLWSLTSNDFLPQYLFNPTVSWTIFTIYVFFLANILATNFSLSPVINRNKMIFLTRLLLFASVPFAYSASLGLAAVHGIEYLGVSNLISNKSQLNARQKFNFHLCVLVLSTIGALLLFSRVADGLSIFYFGSHDKIPNWIFVMASVSIGLTFVHYYLDRIIFKMRRAENREYILPLLTNRKE